MRKFIGHLFGWLYLVPLGVFISSVFCWLVADLTLVPITWERCLGIVLWLYPGSHIANFIMTKIIK